MAKRRSNLITNDYNQSNNVGLGLIGGAVSQNQCLQQDNSFYCQLSRGYSSFIMIISIFAILYILIRLMKLKF